MSKDQNKTMHALIERHRNTVRALAQTRGISNVHVFGSIQRNDGKPDRDVDLLVEFEAGRPGLALGGFQLDVSELLGRRVDVLTEPALHPRIRGIVLREAQPL